MIDQVNRVRQVIARTLRVHLSNVASWELLAKQGTEYGAPGRLHAELRVKLVGIDREVMERFYTGTGTGCWRIQDMQVGYDLGGHSTEPSIVLLYGKETQHIFKAAYQMFTVRRNQKGRKK